jgi:hypothetical protein
LNLPEDVTAQAQKVVNFRDWRLLRFVPPLSTISIDLGQSGKLLIDY